MPDFTDTHQTISPELGYEIADESKQHPNQIKVCAQESYSENGKTKTHDDCFPIQQDNSKTYWYTIFDYPLIEEFENLRLTKTRGLSRTKRKKIGD